MPASSCIRSQPPRQPAKPRKTVAATASRSTIRNDASLVRRFADINIAGQLRDAIDAGRFRLDAQLILPFAGAERARPHYELLIRMIDDEGHTIGPDRFMSAAQRYQLMPAIDRWVLGKTIEMLKPHAPLLAGGSIAFAINFSGQSLNDGRLPGFSARAHRRQRVGP